MHIVYVTDGKAGHRSQALGLYQAMQRVSAKELTFQEIDALDGNHHHLEIFERTSLGL